MMNQDRHEQEVELEIERHVQEIGRLIDRSEPEKQNELRQMVWSLMEQEVLQKTETVEQEEREWMRRPMNPLALGLLFLILGVAVFFLLPPVGLILAFGGVLGIIWGVFIGLTGRKEQIGQPPETSPEDSDALSSEDQNAKSQAQGPGVEGERRSA